MNSQHSSAQHSVSLGMATGQDTWENYNTLVLSTCCLSAVAWSVAGSWRCRDDRKTTSCISYIPVAVVKHHDQKQLKEVYSDSIMAMKTWWETGSPFWFHNGNEDMVGDRKRESWGCVSATPGAERARGKETELSCLRARSKAAPAEGSVTSTNRLWPRTKCSHTHACGIVLWVILRDSNPKSMWLGGSGHSLASFHGF